VIEKLDRERLLDVVHPMVPGTPATGARRGVPNRRRLSDGFEPSGVF
jgi:hypothetical protein